MADDLEARGDSPKRLAAARAQLNAILITDPEIQRVYAPQKYDWGPAISDLLKEVRKGQNPEPPPPVIRQAPIHEMYGPPDGKPIIRNRQ